MSKLYEVVLTGSYFSQQIINRFNYLMTGTPAVVTGSFALASALGSIYDTSSYPSGTLINLIINTVSDEFVLSQITVVNPYDPTDFYEAPFVPEYRGQQTGQAASPTMAYGFRSNRVRTDIARGMKRFVGVTEDYMGDGGVLTGIVSTLEDVAEGLGATLAYTDEGNSLSFAPCIVGKEKYVTTAPTTLPARFAYRYYEDEAVQMEHLAVGVSWQPYSTVRTQTSRQYGRGA